MSPDSSKSFQSSNTSFWSNNSHFDLCGTENGENSWLGGVVRVWVRVRIDMAGMRGKLALVGRDGWRAVGCEGVLKRQ